MASERTRIDPPRRREQIAINCTNYLDLRIYSVEQSNTAGAVENGAGGPGRRDFGWSAPNSRNTVQQSTPLYMNHKNDYSLASHRN